MSRNPITDEQEDMIPRREVDEIIGRLTENLESRVRARTNDLRSANERLLQEIDERRAAEERLRESEELYRFTIELSQQLVWTASPEGRILSVSNGFSALTGLDPDVDPHEAWLAITHPDDLPRSIENWNKGLKSRHLHVGEFRMRIADGSYRMFRSRAAPRFDDQGNVIRWYGSTEDIEDRKIAQAARLRAEELYRLAARATNDAIWDLEIDEQRIHWSETSAETLGYPGRKLGTTSLQWWEERIHPDDRKATSDSLDLAIRRGKSRWSASYRFRRADGEYSNILDRGFIVQDENGKSVRAVGAMADLTDRQHAEQELRRMQAELIHVSRLSAMGTMASTLAHELNQPLTAVTNYLRGSRRLLEDAQGPTVDQALQALEAAESGTLTAGQIVRRIRELVARGNSALRPTELSKLIEDAGVLAFLDEHLMGVTHRIEIEPGAEWVEVDKVQIQQVLINLIRNGMQSMQDQECREILLQAKAVSPKLVEISVADTGTGIPADVRDALFSPFKGTKPEGLGIGLSISRTIVEAHGGKIWASDREGGGTVFRFTLPRWECPDAASARLD